MSRPLTRSIFARALLELAGCMPEYRQIGAAEEQHPGFKILQRVGQHRSTSP